MKRSATLWAVLCVVAMAPVQAQRVVHAPAHLDNLASSLDWAMAQASEAGTILWTVDARSGGWRIGPDSRSLAHILGLPDSDPLRTAILLEIRAGRIARMVAQDLHSPFHEVALPAYVLGHYSQQSTFDAIRQVPIDAEKARQRIWIAGILDQVPAAGTYIREALRTGDVGMRKAAAYSLARHEGDSSLPTLEGIAASGGSTEVAKAAMYAMGSVETDAALAALTRILNSDAPREVRKAGAYAIGNIGTPAARKILLDLIRTEQ